MLGLFSFMATRLVKYPKANMVQFVPEREMPEASRHNFLHYNEWWDCQRRKPNDAKRFYFQKMEQSQRLSVMLHSNNEDFAGVRMTIYNMAWQVVHIIFATTTTIAGYEIQDSEGNWYPANTHTFSSEVASWNIPDGLYYYAIRVPFADGAEVLISEVISLRANHPNTLRVEYTNSKNDFDLFYKDTNLRPTLLVESAIYNLAPNSDDTSYIDERVDVTPLYSTPYDTYTYAVRRVPEWMISKVNRAFSHDTIGISDGIDYKYYAKAKDAKWDYSPNANDPHKSMSITIQEAQNEFSQTIETIEPVTCEDFPMSGTMGILPAPAFNGDGIGFFGVDNSYIRAVIGGISGGVGPITISGWGIVSGNGTVVMADVPGTDITAFDDTREFNFFRRTDFNPCGGCLSIVAILKDSIGCEKTVGVSVDMNDLRCVLDEGYFTTGTIGTNSIEIIDTTGSSSDMEYSINNGLFLPAGVNTGDPFTISGLDPNTTYDIKIRIVCGEEKYGYIGPLFVTTQL